MKNAMKWIVNASMIVPIMIVPILLGGPNVASAQSEAVRQLYVTAATVPTNAPAVHTYADPPNNFNVLVGSDEELATYGFPPRPDKQANPDHYRMWERAMLAAKHRWRGDLKAQSFPNRERLQSEALATRPVDGPDVATNSNSVNWSGVAVTNTLTKFNPTRSFYDIYSIWTVPTGEGPFAGPGDLYQSITWIGLNGYWNQSLEPAPAEASLQGGVLTVTEGSNVGNIYDAVIGWEPAYFFNVFTVNAGDVMYAEVMDPQGGTNPGNIFIEDLTTLTYNSYSLAFPGGLPFIGNSAQWIVERVCCRNSGYPYPMVNNISVFFDGGAALALNGNTYYPGSTATSTHVITMRDDSNSQNIEIVSHGSSGYEGQHGILFQTTGCAFAGGCVEK